MTKANSPTEATPAGGEGPTRLLQLRPLPAINLSERPTIQGEDIRRLATSLQQDAQAGIASNDPLAAMINMTATLTRFMLDTASHAADHVAQVESFQSHRDQRRRILLADGLADKTIAASSESGREAQLERLWIEDEYNTQLDQALTSATINHAADRIALDAIKEVGRNIRAAIGGLAAVAATEEPTDGR